MASEMSQAEERVVLEAIAAGNESRFDELVIVYQSRVFGLMCGMVGNRHDAEELTQETFLSAYKNLGKFAGRSSFYTWLRRIAFNLAIDRQRKNKSQRSRSGERTDAIELLDSRTIDPSEAAVRGESAKLVQIGLQKLSIDARNIIVLRDIQGLDYAEIAELIDVPIGTVRSRLHRARIELRHTLISLGVASEHREVQAQPAMGGES